MSAPRSRRFVTARVQAKSGTGSHPTFIHALDNMSMTRCGLTMKGWSRVFFENPAHESLMCKRCLRTSETRVARKHLKAV